VKIAMKKMFRHSIFAALALAIAAISTHPVNAQQSGSSYHDSPEHLASDAMSVSDNAALQAHQNDLVEAARIYGYNLRVGNWAWEQTLCAPMPSAILLHYLRQFPDGTESLFTALVPRGAGHVRIVPVLDHSAAPFVPAPQNPRNYTLFNELVPHAIAAKAVAPNGNAVALGVCYAELTGGRTNIPPGSGVRVSIAGAPLATTHVNMQDNVIRVTFADREGEHTYKIWAVSFNQNGRVDSVETENKSVYAAMSTPQTPFAPTMEMTKTGRSEQVNEQARQAVTPQPSTAEAAGQPVISTSAASPAAIPASAGEPASEPGWKFVLHPAEPPSKIDAPASQPPEKIIAVPPDPADQTAQENQSPR
jgi:hypothetical protein